MMRARALMSLFCVLASALFIRHVEAASSFVPPQNVTIGVCLDASHPSTPYYRAAIRFASKLANLDYSLIPATDILTTEVDCGSTRASAQLAAQSLINAGVVGLIGGSTELQSAGIAAAAKAGSKPFVAIDYVLPALQNGSVADTWTLRLSPSDYAQASGIWDLFVAYINPSLLADVPITDAVQAHVIYSSDDPLSAAFYAQLVYHSNFLATPIKSTTDLTSTTISSSAITTALQSIQTSSPSTAQHSIWVITPASLLPSILSSASSLSMLSSYNWVLSESNVMAVVSSGSNTIQTQANGMLGLVRAKGYVANDAPFSFMPYTDLAGNSYNYTGFTLATYGSPYPSPDIRTRYAFDSVGTYVRGLSTLLAVATSGAPYEVGSLLLSNLAGVSFVGASGPLSFNANGDRKAQSFAYVQLKLANTAVGYDVIGAWSPLTGSNLYDRTPSLFDRTLSGNSFMDAPVERVDLAYSAVGFANTWNNIPVQAQPPPARYGACIVISKELDSIIVLGGVLSANSVPYSDVWQYSLTSQSWRIRAVTGTKPDARYYGGCMINGDYIYLFGGLGTNGIKGDMWKFQVSTNQWVSLPLASDLAGRAQRAQFGSTKFGGSVGSLAMFGGRHRPTVNTEVWNWIAATEKFDVNQITYNPQSWLQPTKPPYSNDLDVGNLLNSLTAPIAAEATISGRDVLVFVGGYEQDCSVAFIFDVATNVLTPLYTFGDAPGYRSLTQSVIVGTKLFVNQGWDEHDRRNWPTVHSLNLDCPGPNCGLWELHLTFPNSRDSLTSNVFGENVLMFGGWGADIVKNDLTVFSGVRKNEVTVLHGDYYAAPPRKFFSATLVGNQLLIFGGLGTDQLAHSEAYALRLDNQTWIARASSGTTPAARYGHSAASIRLEMYVFGGTDQAGRIFNDLSIYSLYTGEWDSYDPSRYKPEIVAWPKARYFHTSWAVGDRYVFVYGGQSADTQTLLSDLWIWSVGNSRFSNVFPSHVEAANISQSEFYQYDNVAAPTLTDFDFIAPLIQTAVVYYQNQVYFVGGLDGGANPTDYMYLYQLPSDVTTPGSWYRLPKLPSPRNQHACTLLSGEIYCYGGTFYEAARSDLIVFNIASNLWRTVTANRSWNKPRAMAGGSMMAYGNSITMWGGSSAEFLDLHSAFFILPEAWQYSAGAACTGTNPLINGEPCTQCTPGTIPSLQWCVPCSAGTYWSNANGEPECVKCAPGFAGSISGAASFALCIPCANGTYAPTAGMSECTTCDSDKYCPVGSLAQLTAQVSSYEQKFVQSQPEAYVSSAKQIVDDTQILSYVLIATCSAIALLYLLITLGHCKAPMEKLDILYQFNHLNHKNMPMVRRQTPMGGYCTLVAILLVLYLVITLTLPFSLDNIIETRSLIPNVATRKVFRGDIEAKGKLNGYSGACVQPLTYDQCAPGLTVSVGDGQNFVNALNATWTCQNATDTTFRGRNSSSTSSACEVTWHCLGCGVPIKDTVTFSFLADDTFATSIDWSFMSSSGYPDQVSRISGTINSGDDRLFRGTTTPTTVELTLTQTLYTETYSATSLTGYHLNFVDRTAGATTAPLNFYSTNGVRLAYSLQLQLDTMNVERAQKQTTIQFIGSLLGSVSGVISGIAVLMGIFEDVEDLLFLKREKFKSLSSKGRLNDIFEENDQKIIEKAFELLAKSGAIDAAKLQIKAAKEEGGLKTRLSSAVSGGGGETTGTDSSPRALLPDTKGEFRTSPRVAIYVAADEMPSTNAGTSPPQPSGNRIHPEPEGTSSKEL